MRQAIVMAFLAVAVMASPALAERGGHGGGKGQGPGAAADARGNGVGRDGCPPGLAGREPACVPPGQAAQGVTEADWRGRHLLGSTLGADEFTWLVDASMLPLLPDGQSYAIVGNLVVALDQATLQVLDLVATIG